MKRVISFLLIVALAVSFVPGPAACAAVKYKDGIYTKSYVGLGAVTVTIHVLNNRICNVTIDASEESEGIGKTAAIILADEIMDAQSANVDAVSGASLTSNAVLLAAEDCLKRAALSSDTETTAPAPSISIVDGIEGIEEGSIIQSNITTANTVAGQEVFHSNTGHGFSAEAANMQNAMAEGYTVEHTGQDNALNGADYSIKDAAGNITFIQSKYYNTAKGSVDACFGSDGLFKYYSDVGTPMQIEVPKDQYEAAVKELEKKIKLNLVPGVTDPNEAANIIRPGSVTYKQAVNIAKPGNIDSLVFDAKNNCVNATNALGVSAIIRFAVSIWAHDSIDVALKKSIYTGLVVGGNAFATGILVSQLNKAGLNSLLVPGSKALVEAIGPKAAAVIVNVGRVGAAPIYGAAAMSSAAKLLRGNFITGVVSFAVFSIPDMIKLFRGRVSGAQFLKNAAVTAGGIAGGFGGAAAGAAAGTAIFPGLGTIIGGIAGGIAGGLGLASGVDYIADLIAEDDADKMLDIISGEFQTLAEEYLLTEGEAQQVSTLLQEKLTAKTLQEMYANQYRRIFAKNLITPILNKVIAKRPKVTIPEDKVVAEELIETLNEIYDMELSDK